MHVCRPSCDASHLHQVASVWRPCSMSACLRSSFHVCNAKIVTPKQHQPLTSRTMSRLRLSRPCVSAVWRPCSSACADGSSFDPSAGQGTAHAYLPMFAMLCLSVSLTMHHQSDFSFLGTRLSRNFNTVVGAINCLKQAIALSWCLRSSLQRTILQAFSTIADHPIHGSSTHLRAPGHARPVCSCRP